MNPMRSAVTAVFALLAVLGTGCNRDVVTTVEGNATFELSDDTTYSFDFPVAVVLPDEDTADAGTPLAGHCILDGSSTFLRLERPPTTGGPAGLESFTIEVDGETMAYMEATINGQVFEGDCEIDVSTRDSGGGVFAFTAECAMLGAVPDSLILTAALDFDGCK